MKRSQSALLAVLLVAFLTAVLFAQAPVIIEAESGVVGSAFTVSNQSGVGYISIVGTVGGQNPGSSTRVASYTVTFAGPGTYELYARLRIGPAGPNDDSFYYANGFGTKNPADSNDWILANNLGNPTAGFTNPSDKVVGGGLAGNQVWKWVKLTYDWGEPPVVFQVTAGNLTQTFQVAGREDGLDLDKLAFGFQGVYYTVYDLDNGLPGSTEPPPPPYTPPGPPIATGQAKFLGSVHSTSQAVNFTAYWNQVTPENAGKWGSVEATRDVMNWTALDTAYNLAKTNGFPFRMHVLVWGNQQPAWIETLPPAEQLEEIREWFQAVGARYPNLDYVEVVNEPLHDPPSSPGNGGGNYYEALGGAGATGWDWVLNAFRMARTYIPTAKLMINEYSVTNNTADMQRYIQIIQLLQAENLIDAVGVQGHAFSTRPNIPMETHIANLDLLAATGLPIQVTEMDIDGPSDEVQLEDYQRIFPVFWEHPGVEGITLWGYRPGMWRTLQGAYLVYENGAERPAMVWLRGYVPDHAPVVTPGQSLEVTEAAAARAVVGTVLASDADAGAVLSDWRIVGGTGASLFSIDPATGTVSVAAGAALDFETTMSYWLDVSVHDGYRTSAVEHVTVRVLNANDNAPVLTPAQSFRVDGGVCNVLGAAVGADADDTNQPGFTTLQGWAIVGGDRASIFAIDPLTGTIRIAQPLAIDFGRASYVVLVTVGDGTLTSAPVPIRITIPDKVDVYHNGHGINVSKYAAPAHLRHGDCLGTSGIR